MVNKKYEDEIKSLQDQDFYDKGKTEMKNGSPTRRGRPIQNRNIIKTNLDLTPELIEQLDYISHTLNISRQAVIKNYIQLGLQQFYIAEKAKKDTIK